MAQIRIDDANIAYDEIGGGEPLLLIHGMLETARTHAQLALALSSRFRIILPDLRGYGRSTPRPRRFPPDFYSRDAADMAGLLHKLGLSNVRLLGMGDGAEVALLMAIEYPELVRAVTAIDVAGSFTPAILNILPNLGSWAENEDTLEVAWRNAAFKDYGAEGTRAMWRDWRAAIETIVAAGGDISLARASEIRCPVLLINGEDDTLNAPGAQALLAVIPQSELLLMPDMNQLVINKHLRLFTERLLDWFTAH